MAKVAGIGLNVYVRCTKLILDGNVINLKDNKDLINTLRIFGWKKREKFIIVDNNENDNFVSVLTPPNSRGARRRKLFIYKTT